ncbi:glycoside hydrolase family 3 C-terminal domain-containing protein [Sphingobium sp.]|uniref:glycoside hydrolase family 3 C-terminal domain-containing protein n=1 Tax=Sphingobium sp. TaxID=1912891 RepID=UPI00261899C3|nr:glycoside hydrolase family 3 C-terminal domain-containing protein [Sphingobium sp.]
MTQYSIRASSQCFRRVRATAIAALMASSVLISPLADRARAQSASAPAEASAQAVDARVQGLLAQMTLAEKISLLSGGTRFATAAIPRLSIPAVKMADGPNGIRANETFKATSFPASVAMAATWDIDAARQVGMAIGQEARALDYSIVQGPGLNIQRVPVGGRNFEYYSEDPYLSGRMAVNWTQGLQSTGVLATAKHFAANNQEQDRLKVDAIISERTLREIYFPGFEDVVKEANPAMVMAAYNKINGAHSTENKWLLTDVLRNEWGFKGVVVSDWGATHSTAPAINAGLDFEMPAPAKYFGADLLAAVNKGDVSQATIDRAAGHILAMVIRSGRMDGWTKGPDDVVDSPAHRAIALKAAEHAVTLLKNDGNALPLLPAKLKRIAVIGPNADARMIQGGGSSEVTAIRAVTPLEGLKSVLPANVKIDHARGVTNDRFAAMADPRMFSTTADRHEQGLTQRLWTHGSMTGEPTRTMTDDVFMRFYFGPDLAKDPQNDVVLQWTGYFWPPTTGDYDFSMIDRGNVTVMLDGKAVIDGSLPATPSPMFGGFGWKERKTSVHLEGGRAYAFRMDFAPAKHWNLAYRLGIHVPTGSIEQAVEAARGADAAVVFVGSSVTSESEEADRPNIKLYGEQDALVEAVAAVNPRTIVVVNSGGPVEMPWKDKVAAIVEDWFLGSEQGNAIANVLTGNSNPSGKLPMTFPKKLEDNPTYAYYPGKDLQAHYGEELLVGYRWYDAKGIKPLFPFGYGLSYTDFAFRNLKVKPEADGWSVRFHLRNTGKRSGAEVAQLYVSQPASAGEPPRQLKRFERIELAPGASKEVRFHLTRKDFSYWDDATRSWTVAPGTHRILVGGSSDALPLSVELKP